MSTALLSRPRSPAGPPVTDPTSFAHESVLLDRVLELFAPVPAGTVVDATLGGAGHAATTEASRSKRARTLRRFWRVSRRLMVWAISGAAGR